MNIEELKRQLLEQGITEEDLKKDKEKYYIMVKGTIKQE